MSSMWPSVIINLKQHIVGERVKEYVLRVAQAAKKHQQKVAICPAIADVDKAFFTLKHSDETLCEHVWLFAPKVDDVAPGENKTGAVAVESIMHTQGAMINHFETRIYGQSEPHKSGAQFQTLCNIIKKCTAKNLKMVLCADNHVTAEKIARYVSELEMDPENVVIAIEWDAFIGKRISIVKEKPDEIERAVQAVKKVNPHIRVYCGAGIETKEDLVKAKKLGASGFLAATAFTKAPLFGGDYVMALESFWK
ncbi:TPA: hypothetical protein HA249_00325 [Candidatus Woesearchaeota archaeon]|nr:hypothetical protein [Candidatus Woesearchaeota archaeon]